MAKQDANRAEQAAGEALDGLTRAYKEAAAAIEAIPDPQRAFAYATQLANLVRDLFPEASELRSRTVARIWEAEELSLAALAQRIGVSKARADQLIRAAKTARAGKEHE
jgi:3-methyladenine DNA glycosylase/8-oxoguanine DNA glycosylase